MHRTILEGSVPVWHIILLEFFIPSVDRVITKPQNSICNLKVKTPKKSPLIESVGGGGGAASSFYCKADRCSDSGITTPVSLVLEPASREGESWEEVQALLSLLLLISSHITEGGRKMACLPWAKDDLAPALPIPT